MARTVSLHTINVEVVAAITKVSTELQDEIMDLLHKAGHEVMSVESVRRVEKRMPDKEVSANASGLPAEGSAAPGES